MHSIKTQKQFLGNSQISDFCFLSLVMLFIEVKEEEKHGIKKWKEMGSKEINTGQRQ